MERKEEMYRETYLKEHGRKERNSGRGKECGEGKGGRRRGRSIEWNKNLLVSKPLSSFRFG